MHAGKFPNLKHGGRTVSVQKTTTKHSQITIEQQLRWHGNIESVWQEQLQLNHPNEEFSALKAHFMCNVDETGVMANLGSIKVMGDFSKRKQEKNTDDCWDSISIVRIGNAAGSSGPWIFLASGKRMTVKPLQNNEDTIAMWTNTQLQDMLRYFTDPRPVNVMKLDKERLRNAVRASARVCREERATVNPIASV